LENRAFNRLTEGWSRGFALGQAWWRSKQINVPHAKPVPLQPQSPLLRKGQMSQFGVVSQDDKQQRSLPC
jgi:hypothetical protein